MILNEQSQLNDTKNNVAMATVQVCHHGDNIPFNVWVSCDKGTFLS